MLMKATWSLLSELQALLFGLSLTRAIGSYVQWNSKQAEGTGRRRSA